MNINGIQLILRSLRIVAVPVMLLAAVSLVACNNSSNACKDACDGIDQEIEICEAACDGVIL